MKRKMFLGLCMATFIAPVAMAQYPQLTEEAKQAYKKMMSEERRRSDEAWAKAFFFSYFILKKLYLCYK